MATINVLFNNKEYPIDESSLSSATSALKTHLSTIMNGSGATVALDGTSYNVDSTKLSTARNNFVTYLGTISGNGAKVVVNGVEYSVDSTKLATAIADLHTVLGDLNSGSEGGEGSEGGSDRQDYMPYFGEQYSYTLTENGVIYKETIICYEDGSVCINTYKNDVSIGLNEYPVGTLTYVGSEVFLDGAVVGEENPVLFATISKDGTQVTMVDDGRVYTVEDISGSEGSNSDYIPGLYQTGAIAKYESEGAAAIEGMMIKSWDELVAEGSIVIDNGAVYAGTVLVMPEDLPEKNEYGFYYDVLYSDGYGFGFVFHEDTSVDVYSEGGLQPCPAGLVTYSENSIDMTQIGFPVLTVSSDGFTMDLGDGYYISVKTPIPFAGDLMLASNCGITALGNYDEDTEEGNYAFIRKNELTGVFIPDGVTSIGEYAFSDCWNLTSITIPNGVMSIDDYAFYRCSNLTSINIPDGVTSIDAHAFDECISLTSITIPDGVTSIGDYAFNHCTSLTSITLGNSVTSIGGLAFAGCYGLTSITFEGTIAQWNAIEKGERWNGGVPATQVVCSDGTVAL